MSRKSREERKKAYAENKSRKRVLADRVLDEPSYVPMQWMGNWTIGYSSQTGSQFLCTINERDQVELMEMLLEYGADFIPAYGKRWSTSSAVAACFNSREEAALAISEAMEPWMLMHHMST